MEDSLNENDNHCVEHDSLSSDSFSRDSLLNGHSTEQPPPETSMIHPRRGSYTLETSPEMSISIRNTRLSRPIFVQTNNDNHRHSLVTHDSSNTNKVHKVDMTQSLYERPWVTQGKSNSLAKAYAKQREEKLRLAKEEQDLRLKQKRAVLDESEKTAQQARIRKETESLRKLEEMKRKALERQKIVEERKERLLKAEEARRKLILRKLVNVTAKKPSPQSSNNMMTMSCYGGFGSTRNRPGNKEVVQNRFMGNRPLSSTGRIIGFGSSTPRPICETPLKINNENKKIPEAILIKCEILSRPSSSRMSDRMMTSVISPPVSVITAKLPQRQSSFKEKDGSKGTTKSTAMTTSMIDFSPKNKLRSQVVNKASAKSDLVKKSDMTTSVIHQNKSGTGDIKKNNFLDVRPPSASSNSTKISDDKNVNKNSANSVPRRTKKTKVDTHIDSDSIEEEVSRTIHPQKSGNKNEVKNNQARNQIMETSETTSNNETNSQAQPVSALPTKDLSEAEYKARLMENRRLVREKREKEREQLMKSERDKRHAEEQASREQAEIDRENNSNIEETHFTTSNDDTLDGPVESREYSAIVCQNEENQLSEIAETPSVTYNELPQVPNKNEEEKNERRKKLDLIMSRIRKPNDDSSSDGGVSPRRAMSPEPAELEPDVNNLTSAPAFKSSLLQSMMNKGRLAKVTTVNKEITEGQTNEGVNLVNVQPSTVLSSVRESMEDSESIITNINSPSSAAIRSSGIEGNSLSDANSEFAPEQFLETYEEMPEKDSTLSYVTPEVDREDCDGKEDSLSINETQVDSDHRMHIGTSKLSDVIRNTSQSSTETEEEEIIKRTFEIESLYGASSLRAVSQETSVFQN